MSKFLSCYFNVSLNLVAVTSVTSTASLSPVGLISTALQNEVHLTSSNFWDSNLRSFKTIYHKHFASSILLLP